MHPFPSDSIVQAPSLRLSVDGDEGALSRRYESVPRNLARGYAAGPNPFRILVSATDAFAGRGVASHSWGLIGLLARELAASTGHGIDVEIAMAASTSAARAVDDLRATVHDSMDVVIVELEPMLLASRSLPEIGEELLALTKRLARHTRLVLLVQAPVPPETAARIDRLLGRFDTPVHLHLLAAPSTDPRSTYQHWARGLAQEIAPHLRVPGQWIATGDVLDAEQRHRAIARLSVLEDGWSELLHEFTLRARAAYRTRSAAVTLIDHEMTRFAPSVGPNPGAVDRAQTICDVTLTVSGGLIVSDATADTRFRGLGCVAKGDLRFYAGYRIRDPRGVPVGTVCVFDGHARVVGFDQLQPLRAIAADIEHVLASRLR